MFTEKRLIGFPVAATISLRGGYEDRVIGSEINCDPLVAVASSESEHGRVQCVFSTMASAAFRFFLENNVRYRWKDDDGNAQKLFAAFRIAALFLVSHCEEVDDLCRNYVLLCSQEFPAIMEEAALGTATTRLSLPYVAHRPTEIMVSESVGDGQLNFKIRKNCADIFILMGSAARRGVGPYSERFKEVAIGAIVKTNLATAANAETYLYGVGYLFHKLVIALHLCSGGKLVSGDDHGRAVLSLGMPSCFSRPLSTPPQQVSPSQQQVSPPRQQISMPPQQIAGVNYEVVDCGGGGDCFFRSVAAQSWQFGFDADRQMEVRVAIAVANMKALARRLRSMEEGRYGTDIAGESDIVVGSRIVVLDLIVHMARDIEETIGGLRYVDEGLLIDMFDRLLELEARILILELAMDHINSASDGVPAAAAAVLAAYNCPDTTYADRATLIRFQKQCVTNPHLRHSRFLLHDDHEVQHHLNVAMIRLLAAICVEECLADYSSSQAHLSRSDEAYFEIYANLCEALAIVRDGGEDFVRNMRVAQVCGWLLNVAATQAAIASMPDTYKKIEVRNCFERIGNYDGAADEPHLCDVRTRRLGEIVRRFGLPPLPFPGLSLGAFQSHFDRTAFDSTGGLPSVSESYSHEGAARYGAPSSFGRLIAYLRKVTLVRGESAGQLEIDFVPQLGAPVLSIERLSDGRRSAVGIMHNEGKTIRVVFDDFQLEVPDFSRRPLFGGGAGIFGRTPYADGFLASIMNALAIARSNGSTTADGLLVRLAELEAAGILSSPDGALRTWGEIGDVVERLIGADGDLDDFIRAFVGDLTDTVMTALRDIILFIGKWPGVLLHNASGVHWTRVVLKPQLAA
ncbi:MAG: hypothetical protein LBI39_00645 [Puniceicoccales bacterium]|jgi:hypothetical protein|nr:hypothetical protein [Puniceicoccales bacterium]